MKTAIYIEDGAVQLVITPESDFEKNAIKMFQEKPLETQIYEGSFYDCRGGWTRQTEYYQPMHFERENDKDKSLIIRLQEEETKAV